MDWELAIERNRDALKRILAALVAMAGLGALTSPLVGEDGSARRGKAETLAEPDEGSSRPTLPRHLHRAVLRLLRPAESAARRLIVVAARDIVVELPPIRPRKSGPGPDLKAGHAALRSLGIAVMMSLADFARAAAEKPASAVGAATGPRRLSLPLLDPLRRPFRGGCRNTTAQAAPRILFPGFTEPPSLPAPRSPYDPVDSTRLALRLAALSRALDDLPGHARRFARWQSRKAAERRDAQAAQARKTSAGLMRRISPLRLGRPPGQRSTGSRRAEHEVHEVLADLHWFAREALAQPDTS